MTFTVTTYVWRNKKGEVVARSSHPNPFTPESVRGLTVTRVDEEVSMDFGKRKAA